MTDLVTDVLLALVASALIVLAVEVHLSSKRFPTQSLVTMQKPIEESKPEVSSLQQYGKKLDLEISKLEEKLKSSKHFEEITELSLTLGLKNDFSNFDEVIPKLVMSWKGDSALLYSFINLLGLVRDKKKLGLAKEEKPVAEEKKTLEETKSHEIAVTPPRALTLPEPPALPEQKPEDLMEQIVNEN